MRSPSSLTAAIKQPMLKDRSPARTPTAHSYGVNPSFFGTDSWVLGFTGVSTTPGTPFVNSVSELIGLNYTLERNNGVHHSGTFHFALVDFNGGASPGPNTLTDESLVLWGNNWINGLGTKSTTSHPLGIDLYATTAMHAPEPSTLLLLGTGLAAVAVRRYRRKK